MSHIIKLGAAAISNDMLQNCSTDEREQALSWHAGFCTGLHDAGILTDDELDDLTINLEKEKE